MNKKINNNRLFILFSFLVFLIILVFVYALYKTLSYDNTIYTISKGSFIYDKNYDYLTLEDDAKMQQKWDKNYYLTEKKTNKIHELGSDVVVFNKNDFRIYLYGENYQVKVNGDVKYSNKVVNIAKNGESTFFKLSDRKYLMTGTTIKSDVKGIKTNNYLIVDIDKSGNALLLNNELNIKALSTLKLKTKLYELDVANERLYIGKEVIELKKINGSSNKYKEEKEEEKSKDNNKTNTQNNKNNNNSNNSRNKTNSIASSSSNSSKKENLNIVKSASLISVASTASYIDVSYSIIDPKNEYTTVFLLLQKLDNSKETKKIIISKNNNSYRIRDLVPNTEYKVSLCYTIVGSDDSNTLEDEVANELITKTKKDNTKIVINKISGNNIYYTVFFDESYAFDSADVVLYSDNNQITSQAVNAVNAVSSKGHSGVLESPTAFGYEVKIRLENCTYQNEQVNTNVQTKFINR